MNKMLATHPIRSNLFLRYIIYIHDFYLKNLVMNNGITYLNHFPALIKLFRFIIEQELTEQYDKYNM